MQNLQSMTLREGQKPVEYEPIPEMLMSAEEFEELLKTLAADALEKEESLLLEKEYLLHNSWHR